MKPKPLFLFALASACGLVATISASRYLSERQTTVQAAAPEPLQKQVVAALKLAAGTVLTEESVRVAEVPASLAVADAYTDPLLIVGKVIRYPLAANEPIVPEKVAGDDVAALQKKLRRGMRAFSVGVVDPASRIGGNIKVGDRVDVILVVDSEEGVEATARTIMQNIEVLGVGRTAPRAAGTSTTDERPNEQHITLAVTKQQVNELSLAQERGRLKLSVRGANDDDTADVADVSASSLTGNERPSEPAEPVVMPAPDSYTIQIIERDKVKTQSYISEPVR